MIRRSLYIRLLIVIGVALSVVAYLAIVHYNEFRALLVRQEPKILASNEHTKQCNLINEKKNQHKLMFVSCSGFYDEE
ncbi:MAG: hypothetical protein WDZ93_01545 [Candidatus Paceibacterota bacterium]